jgi:hypothetical protein
MVYVYVTNVDLFPAIDNSQLLAVEYIVNLSIVFYVSVVVTIF